MNPKRRSSKYVPVKVTGRIDGIPVRPFVTGLARRIEAFWNRYDDEGVKRTVHFDECDRQNVSRALAKHLLTAIALLLLCGGCSVWRLRTPKFTEGPQTNSVGEVWYLLAKP